MLFTRSVDYAVKALIAMARNKEGKYYSARELSTQIDCSSTYLSKILQKLTEAQLLYSGTGPGKGYEFRVPPEKIRLSDVIRAFGEENRMQECFFGWPNCNESVPCPFHEDYAQFRGQLRAKVDQCTILDAIPHWPYTA